MSDFEITVDPPPEITIEVNTSGPPGPQGPAGEAGTAGPVGPQGPEGPAGAAGQTGSTGPVGPQGPEGPAGGTGAQGPIGPDGPAGPKGDTGAVGPQGPIGDSGPPGSTGPAGPEGPVGPVGPAGPLGPEDIIAGTNITIVTTPDTVTINATGSGSGGGVTDHGDLTGLADPDHPISAVAGLQEALDAKAPTASPALTGTPTAPTQPLNTAGTALATVDYANTQAAYVVDQHELVADPHPQYSEDGHVHTSSASVRSYLLYEDAADPAAGSVHVEATGGANRIFRVSKTDADGNGYTLILLIPGDNVTLTDDPSAPPITSFARYSVVSDVTDETTYWQFSAIRTDTSGSTNTPAGTRVRFIPTLSSTPPTAPVTHGSLEGLDADDHTQYLTNARGDARYDVAGAATSGDAAHVAAPDPHPQYATLAYADQEVTVATAAPTEAPARDGLLWVVVAP